MSANVLCTFSSANGNLWLNLTMGEIQFVNFPDEEFAHFFFCLRLSSSLHSDFGTLKSDLFGKKRSLVQVGIMKTCTTELSPLKATKISFQHQAATWQSSPSSPTCCKRMLKSSKWWWTNWNCTRGSANFRYALYCFISLFYLFFLLP